MAQPDVGIDVSGVDVADVDRVVRVAVPAYGRIFVDCADLIGTRASYPRVHTLPRALLTPRAHSMPRLLVAACAQRSSRSATRRAR